MNYYITKTPKTLEFAEKHLTYDNPNYQKAIKLGIPQARYIPKHIRLYKIYGNYISIPFGTYNYLKSKYGENNSFKAPNVKYEGNINLYDYQRVAVDYMANTTNCLLISSTGSGKTQMGIALIQKLGLRTLWITHTQDLLDQSKSRFLAHFKNEVGEIAEGKVNIQNITFALIQTLSKIDLDLYRDMFDCIIIDEVQHCSTNINNTTMYEKVLSHLDASYRYGLTATLHRADGLEGVIRDLISYNEYRVNEKDIKKLKASYKVIKYNEKPEKEVIGYNEYTCTEIKAYPYLDSDGTINYTKLINYLCNNEKRTQMLVDLVNKNKDRNIAILTLRKSHCKRLNDLIDNSYYLDSNSPRNTRKRDLEVFRETRNKVFIATYQLAKEGLDIPNLDMLILATPVKDETILIQSIGRIERYQESKKTPIVYDIVDSEIGYCENLFKKNRKKILQKYNYVIEYL